MLGQLKIFLLSVLVVVFVVLCFGVDSKSLDAAPNEQTFDKLDQLLSKYSKICGRVLEQDSDGDHGSITNLWKYFSEIWHNYISWKRENFEFLWRNRRPQNLPILVATNELSTTTLTNNSSIVAGRIVGGNDALPNQFPWQISLRRWSTAQHRWYHSCGGSVIDSQWILTAAHCTVHSKNISDYLVRVGEYDYSKTEGNEIDFNVSKIIFHSNFTMETIDADISLIKLSTPINIGLPNSTIVPICIGKPPQEDTVPLDSNSNDNTSNINTINENENTNFDDYDRSNHNNLSKLNVTLNSIIISGDTSSLPATKVNLTYIPGKVCYSTGWGRIQHKGKFPTILQKVQLDLIEQKSCQQAYEGVNPITDGMLCSGREGKGTCQGDSGGPLQCLEELPTMTNGMDTGEKRWTLRGLTSWAVGCAEPGYPSVSTRVAYYRDWIAEKMTEN